MHGSSRYALGMRQPSRCVQVLSKFMAHGSDGTGVKLFAQQWMKAAGIGARPTLLILYATAGGTTGLKAKEVRSFHISPRH